MNSALEEGTYKVRAITRSASSDKDNALASCGVELMAADIGDEQSLVNF